MSMSNEQIFDRLQQLGCDPPPINENNRMYALAMIYNSELEMNIDQYESPLEEEIGEYSTINKNQRRKLT